MLATLKLYGAGVVKFIVVSLSVFTPNAVNKDGVDVFKNLTVVAVLTLN